MKKIVSFILACCLFLALAGCSNAGIYIHDEPTPTAAVQTEEPVLTTVEEPRPDVEAAIGKPVIVNMKSLIDTYQAPDGSGRLILTYGYDAAKVFMENNPDAAEKINSFLLMQDELLRSGTVPGEGVNAMLELATDNYALMIDTGKGGNLEFSWMRSAFVERGDSAVLTIRYRVNSYTGGTHGQSTDRAFVFDVRSGDLLSIDDLFADRAAMEDAMLKKMLSMIQSDVRYQTVQDYMKTFKPDEKLEDVLVSLIREGSWLLDNTGFVVFSDIGDIGSYSDGIIRFTLTYEELDGLFHEEYLPPVRPEDGDIVINDLHDEQSAGVVLRDAVTVNESGSEFRIYSVGTIYDVSIDSVTYFSDHIGFYQKEMHWFCSYLSDAGVQVTTVIPEGMPDLMVRYTDSGGEVHSLLVTESGENGQVVLMDQAEVTAVG